MKVIAINNQYNQGFGNKYKLSKETVKAVENSTGLTYKEMTELPLDECAKLMKDRGKLKEPGKLKMWLSQKYKELGEKFGLLEKHYNFYTDID